ncbi:hypothetical protein JY572_16040 [Myxococcus landrumensis]|uniref:Immunity MXAN-0049 protein domain-containing protein n=2 Tax=Myxococcus landrumensis TaxID=2813577 RepID=A0ABX7NHN9_9BACT|nr:hypothetical protein JY572_16040 [Myxococcus landrumus]
MEDVRAGSWFLGDLLDETGQAFEDFWRFSEGGPVPSVGRLKSPIEAPGTPLDFSSAGVGMTPILHLRLAAIFAELAPEDVQLVPVEVKGCSDPYVMLVATKLIRCIDEKSSREVLFYLPEDELPELVGPYRSVAGMRIDPTRVGSARVFRTWGWSTGLIVSEAIKTALAFARVTGAAFEDV